jgi:uncharacterized membrane protein YtjA (UPF0391 family)
MLRASVIFFVMGLLVYIFGALGYLGVSMEIGKLLLLTFLIFSFISFIGGVTTDRSHNLSNH